MNTSNINIRLILGVGITLAAALGCITLTSLPVLNYISPLAAAIFLSIIYRHIFGYPEKYKPGLEFSEKYLLKAAVVLYGLKLNISIIFEEGWQLVLMSAGVICFSLIFIFFLNYFLKGDARITALLGFGTGICGAAAIAATSSIMKTKEQDAAISIGIISVVGTILALIYPLIYNVFDMTEKSYAVWAGLSLHEVANVALAGYAAGDEGMTFAILAKLSRVLLLIPVCLLLIIFMKRLTSRQGSQTVAVPYFLFGFILMSIINTLFDIPESILNSVDQLTALLLIMAMVGIGLKVSLKDIKERAVRPLFAVIITSLVLSAATFYIAVTFW